MKPRRLEIASPASAERIVALEAELALALREIAGLRAWKDRASIIMLRLNERLARLEEHAGIDAQPEPGGQSVAGFAAKVHRSKSAVRKMIAKGRLPLLPSLGVHPIIAADAVLPPRERRRKA